MDSSIRYPTPSQFQTPSQFDFGSNEGRQNAYMAMHAAADQHSMMPDSLSHLGNRFVIPQNQLRSSRYGFNGNSKNSEKALRGQFQKLKENAFKALEQSDWLFGTECFDFTEAIPNPLPFECEDTKH